MPFENFELLMETLLRRLRSNDWGAVLELIETEQSHYPERRAQLTYFRICALTRLDRAAAALDGLREALERGDYYGEVLLRRSPALQPLQNQPVYEELVAWSLRLAAEGEGPGLKVEVREPESGGADGLLIALHSNGSRAEAFIPHWGAASAAGWRVAAPQSSQIHWAGTYGWDDAVRGMADVQAHYAALCERYRPNPERIVLAGHSLGGQMALRAALSGSLALRGFLLVGPYFPRPAEWEPMIAAARGRALRGYVLVGERDGAIPHDAVQQVVAWLQAAAIPCELEMMPGQEHPLTGDFGPFLMRALDFIEGPAEG